MKVYVAVQGLYSSQGVVGVYDSPERAIADLSKPGDTWTRETWVQGDRTFVTWKNNWDWEEHVSIEAFELTDTGPVQAADSAEHYSDSADGRSIVHVTEAI